MSEKLYSYRPQSGLSAALEHAGSWPEQCRMLSQQTRYALKALMYLAASDPARPHRIGEIAAASNIPRKFLEAILVDMKHAGIVHSRRGQAGGYMLARAPAEVTFGEVIRASEGPLALVPCASKRFYRRCVDCPDEAACALRRVMAEARDQLCSVLDHRSLADAIAGGGVIGGTLEAGSTP